MWLDMTDIVDYNVALVNHNDLQNTFFCLSKDDPTVGFLCDASQIAGHVCGDQAKPETAVELAAHDSLQLRLSLGSHLAQYLRLQLEEQKGYTATVGISTNKMLSKLVGNVNKPRAQTTLVPPYTSVDAAPSNVTKFIDSHEVGRIPGIGFKMAQKLREHYLQRPAHVQEGLVTFNVKDNVTVRQLRTMPEMGPLFLEKILGGPGWPADVGYKTWALMHGVDDTEVGQAREIPKQISLEDSYVRLDTYEEVMKELKALSRSLIKRMHVDLTEEEHDDTASASRRWLAHPRTVRLSARPRGAQDPITSTRARSFQRMSRSAPLPNFIFSLSDSIDAIAERLVDEVLIPLFRRLHPEKLGWNLSLINIAVTNMAETAGDNKFASGRDIGSMFRKQEDTLREWKVEDRDVPPDDIDSPMTDPTLYKEGVDVWLSDEELEAEEELVRCPACGAQMPPFAIAAHQRFHETGE